MFARTPMSAPRSQTVLALNAGSRSHRAQLFVVEREPALDPPPPLWEGADESAAGTFSNTLAHYRGASPEIVVHRFVHPGPELAERRAFELDAFARDAIARCDLAPSHNPLALEGLSAAQTRFPNARQIGISDIALPPNASDIVTTYPVPFDWRERYGVRRYGFHGISHRDALARNARLCGRDDDVAKTISVHLGSGCSIVAAHGATIVDSTMGMTPLEGLMMGARCGSIDLGIVFTLLRRGVVNVDDLERSLSKDSGLQGVSGVSSDTREITAAADAGGPRARLALDLYAYTLRKAIGAMAAALGGIDVLSFTGPVGEHSPALRSAACSALAFLGVAIDERRNYELPTEGSIGADVSIGNERSRVRLHVVQTLEEWAMAREAIAFAQANTT